MTNNKFQREVFSIVGLPPEVLAVAMAKYSRSAKSIKQAIDELTEEKSAKFHEKWVLGYGDASVADMAVIAVAFENVSILASKAIEDNRLASYQEKSTRYQVFDVDRYYKPQGIMSSSLAGLYSKTANYLFENYNIVVEKMKEFYANRYPKPADMNEKVYQAKLKARACDVARYILPAATLTNFGMIANARTMRYAISKFLGHDLPELREISKDLERAATQPAYNPQFNKLKPLFNQLINGSSKEVQKISQEIIKAINLQIKGAPTLVKHTEPKEYFNKTKKELEEASRRHLSNLDIKKDEPRLDYLNDDISYEDDLITSLLYSVTHYSYQQILAKVKNLLQDDKKQIINIGTKHRTQWDWPTRPFEVAGYFSFDTLMDYGAFRDLQRHRMCTQINQTLTCRHGYEIPIELGAEEAGLVSLFQEIYRKAQSAWEEMSEEFPKEAQYIIPLGFRKRTIFKMNLRELFHIVELRTKPGGHISYRNLCYDMFTQVKKRHPLLVQNMRAVKPDFKYEFFER
ncbi:FAD-dependent thymidylate synthase [Patescibacteria group bacterium]|nr:FAD-dependent thymidylate synthase [Patescibacteria group bacterium]MBU0964088.1 FAD-dependent thymidylate synthase [Patescibacteria group bacterium]